MKIATYNVNGVNGRLPVLLRWLNEAQPDIVCLQELKAPQEKFPLADIRKAGYGAIWHGQKAWNGVAILARGTDPVETRRGLPGDPEDVHSRYIEAAVGGLTIGCLYLPNGNPAPGPKFDYKLAWFERLQKYGKTLIASDAPFIMAGDYNVMPTDLDVYAPERWRDDALFRPEVRKAYAEFVKLGWTDALRHLWSCPEVWCRSWAGQDLRGGSSRAGSCGRGSGQHEGEIIAHGGDGFQGHVAGPLHRPLIVLLEENGADQASDRSLVGEDADHVGASLDLAVDALERIGRVDLGPVLPRERHVREDVLLGLVKHCGELRQLGADLVRDVAPLRLGGAGVVLGEGGSDERRHHAPAALAGMGEPVAHEVHPAALPGGAEHAGDRGLDALVRIRDDELDPDEPAAF